MAGLVKGLPSSHNVLGFIANTACDRYSGALVHACYPNTQERQGDEEVKVTLCQKSSLDDQRFDLKTNSKIRYSRFQLKGKPSVGVSVSNSLTGPHQQQRSSH